MKFTKGYCLENNGLLFENNRPIELIKMSLNKLIQFRIIDEKFSYTYNI